MRYRVTHSTTYHYDAEVTSAQNQARLAPRRARRQDPQTFVLEIDPEPIDAHDHRDHFGNRVDQFSIHQPHRTLVVSATSDVEVTSEAGALAELRMGPLWSAPWADVRERLHTSTDEADLHARQFVLPSPMVALTDELEVFARESIASASGVGDVLLALNHRIATEFDFDPHATTTTTAVADVLAERRGVCQDFAHLLIGCLRSIGVPARYVSGYLETEAAAGAPKLIGVDASHAWVAAYLPGFGWLDLDPTNDLIPDDRHVITAWGRDYADVAPLKGVVFSSGGGHHLDVAVDVQRLTN